MVVGTSRGDAISSSRLASRWAIGRDDWTWPHSPTGSPHVPYFFDARIPPGGSVGSGGMVLDADGQQVLGAEGKPLIVHDPRVPRAGTINERGEFLDGDGQLVLGSDGQALKAGQVPAGGCIGAYGVVLDGSGKPLIGNDGRAVLLSDPRLPRDGSIGVKGEVLDAFGQAVLGADGRPICVELLRERALSPVDRRRQAFLTASAESRFAAEAARRAKSDGRKVKMASSRSTQKESTQAAAKTAAGRRATTPRIPPPSVECEVLAAELGVPTRKLDLCAIRLQAALRGKLQRRQVERLRRGEDPQISSIVMQRVERGRQARRRVKALWEKAREKAVSKQLATAANLEGGVQAGADESAYSTYGRGAGGSAHEAEVPLEEGRGSISPRGTPLGEGEEGVSFWLEQLPTVPFESKELRAIRGRKQAADVRPMDADAETAISNGSYYVAVCLTGGRTRLLCRCWDVVVAPSAGSLTSLEPALAPLPAPAPAPVPAPTLAPAPMPAPPAPAAAPAAASGRSTDEASPSIHTLLGKEDMLIADETEEQLGDEALPQESEESGEQSAVDDLPPQGAEDIPPGAEASAEQPSPPPAALLTISHQLDMVAILDWDEARDGLRTRVVKAETGPYALSPRSYKGVLPASRTPGGSSRTPGSASGRRATGGGKGASRKGSRSPPPAATAGARKGSPSGVRRQLW